MTGNERTSSENSHYGRSPYQHSMNATCSQYVISNVDELSELLELPEPFTARDIDVGPESLGPLRTKNVIEQVGTTFDSEAHRTIRTWRLTPGARERLESVLDRDRDAELPCGHSGWVNDPDVDGVRCKYCGAVTPKAVLR